MCLPCYLAGGAGYGMLFGTQRGQESFELEYPKNRNFRNMFYLNPCHDEILFHPLGAFFTSGLCRGIWAPNH